MMEIGLASSEVFGRVETMLQGVPGGAEKAWKAIIPRANATARKTALEGITSVYDIKEKDVRDRKNTTIKMRTSKVDGGIVGYITYSGNKIPLYRFGVKPKNPAPRRHRVPVNIGGEWVLAHPGGEVRARQMKNQQYTRFSNDFIATMRSGHTGILRRTGMGRTPVSERMGASTAQMAARSVVREKVEAAAMETVLKRTEHEITRILQGHGR